MLRVKVLMMKEWGKTREKPMKANWGYQCELMIS